MSYEKRMVEPSEINPWAMELYATIKTKNKSVATVGKNRLIYDEKGKETEDLFIQEIKRKVDKEEFVKFFAAGIVEMLNLNKSARDLFEAVLKVYMGQRMSGERVYVTPSILKDNGYTKSKSMRVEAMNALLNKGFLCEVKNEPGMFWVNPTLFFKGDRLKVVQDIAVKGTKADSDQDRELEERRKRLHVEKLEEMEREAKAAIENKSKAEWIELQEKNPLPF